MKILSLDSATECATVALLEDFKVLGEINFNYKKQHSTLLMSMIDELLKASSMEVNDLDGFVVSKGPGSFTGLRIGMATIKGLSLGLNKPYISISSLDALAYNVYGTEGILCPIMDALRNNVYTCIYEYINGELSPITDYMALSINELSDILKTYDKTIYFVGDGTKIHKEYLKSELSNCYFAPQHLNFVRASALGEIGMKKLLAGMRDDANNSAPIYLRKSQAEREYDRKMGLGENE